MIGTLIVLLFAKYMEYLAPQDDVLATWVGSIGTVLAILAVAVQVNSEHKWSSKKTMENNRSLFLLSNRFQISKGDSVWSCFKTIDSGGMSWLLIQVLNEKYPRDIYIDVQGKHVFNIDGNIKQESERRIILIPGIDSTPILVDTHNIYYWKMSMYYKTASDEINKVVLDRATGDSPFAKYDNESDNHLVRTEYNNLAVIKNNEESRVYVDSTHIFADDKFFVTDKAIYQYRARHRDAQRRVTFFRESNYIKNPGQGKLLIEAIGTTRIYLFFTYMYMDKIKRMR
ncbi:hypothetical protein FD37_GL001671 [Levilactobacillus spicheri DSM 15429]|nr:hypothetical protein FD37_GL001671 [Levilactobacillus spicheri DSM 15429]